MLPGNGKPSGARHLEILMSEGASGPDLTQKNALEAGKTLGK